MNWKYVSPTTLENIFLVEKKIGYQLPDNLKAVILENNNGRPERDCFDTEFNQGLQFKQLLSFNENDVDAAAFKAAYQAIDSDEYIPFAIDPFGNHFCYSIKTRKIAFYEHEEEVFDQTNYSLDEFLEHLY